MGRQSPSKEEQLLEVGKLLVGCGADIDAKGTFYGPLGVTPLEMVAHSGGNLPLSRFLIAKGAKISTLPFRKPLHIVVGGLKKALHSRTYFSRWDSR